MTRLALGLGACLVLPGCGLLLNRGPSVLDLHVVPDGATITVKGVDIEDERREAGPRVRLALDRGSSYAILVSADGYKPRLACVGHRVSAAYWLDLAPALLAPLGTMTPYGAQLGTALASACLLGLGVDLLAHTLYEHDARALELPLEPQGAAR